VIVGNGTAINQGSIVVRGGRIVSAAAGPAGGAGGPGSGGRGAAAKAGVIAAPPHRKTPPQAEEQKTGRLGDGANTKSAWRRAAAPRGTSHCAITSRKASSKDPASFRRVAWIWPKAHPTRFAPKCDGLPDSA